jgi:hypothetical protein
VFTLLSIAKVSSLLAVICTYSFLMSSDFNKSCRNKFITIHLISVVLFKKVNKRTKFKTWSQALTSCTIKIYFHSHYGAQGWTDLTKLVQQQKTEQMLLFFRIAISCFFLFACSKFATKCMNRVYLPILWHALFQSMTPQIHKDIRYMFNNFNTFPQTATFY